MRKFITLLLTLLLVFSLFCPAYATEEKSETSTPVENAESEGEKLDPRVEAMIAWAVEIAEDDSHGYSQNNRYGPDYDCTSLVCTALTEGGFALERFLSPGGMVRELPKLGFAVYRKNETEPQRGDILVEIGVHAEICLGDGACVAAHQNYGHSRSGDKSGKEIECRSPEGSKCYFCAKAQYDYILRYEGPNLAEGGAKLLEALQKVLSYLNSEQFIQQEAQ